MKRWIACLVILCMVITLYACKKDNTSDKTPTNVVNANAAEPLDNEPVTSDKIPVAQKTLYSVSVPVITEETLAEDGTLIYSRIYQDMELIGPEPAVADAVILDFLNRIDTATSEEKSILEAAQANYTAGSHWNPYLCQITFTPYRIDSSILSLFGCYASYSGSSHPTTAYPSVTYNLSSGKVLTMGDILVEGVDTQKLSQLVIDALATQKDDIFLYEGFEDTVNTRFSKKISQDADWYLTDEGLCFYFAPYDVAPYSSGAVSACVVYSDLTGILDDAFFPAETEESEGEISVEAYDSATMAGFTQIAECITGAENEKIVLSTEGYVQNLRIDTGYFIGQTDYQKEHTVFASASLTPGDGIVVQASLSDPNHQIRITYQTTAGTHAYYIQKTETGIDLVKA